MKNRFKTGMQILAVGGAIAILVTAAFAYTNPTGTPTSGNVPAPINTGSFDQTKSGGNLGLATNGSTGGNLFATGGVFASNALFGPNIASASALLAAAQSTGNIDIFDALSSTGKGIQVNSNGNLAITSGNPAAGDVLTSDANGNASWQPASAGGGSTGSVSTSGLIEYKEVDAGSTNVSIAAMCDQGYTVIGGGGNCDTTGGGLEGYLTQSAPTYDTSGHYSSTQNTGWYVHCGSASGNPEAHAYAVCMKTTTLATPATSVGWHDVTVPHGNPNESCASWLLRTMNFTVTSTNVRVNNSTSGILNGFCVYGVGVSSTGNEVGSFYANTSTPLNSAPYPSTPESTNGGAAQTQIYY